MRRREFMSLLSGAGVAWPFAARAQQPAMPVVGFLSGQSAAPFTSYVAAFHRGLEQTGYVEGRNVAIEYRWVEGQYDRARALADDLVRRKVTVLVVGGATAVVLTAKAATMDIPIIFTTGSDPVKVGLVQALNRPGANLTGVSFFINELHSKRLGLLHELLPNANSIGLLINPLDPNAETDTADAQMGARVLGLDLHLIYASTEPDIDRAFAKFVQMRVNAVLVEADAFFVARRNHFAELTLRYALPTIHSLPEEAAAGCLMSYSASQTDAWRQVGIYTGRILKGERPSDLPVMLPTRFEFVINLKTAKALSLQVPDKLLALVDSVIE
jgi:putative ABC transport system substrate-binding protein